MRSLKVDNKRLLSVFGVNHGVIIAVLIFLLFLILPSINDATLINSTVVAKTIFFWRFLLILFAVHLLTNSLAVNKKLELSKIDIVLLGLLLYFILNRYLIQNSVGLSIRFIEFLGLALLYIFLRKYSLKYFPWLMLAIILSGIIQAVYGTLQLLGHYPSLNSSSNISGSYFNSGPYAGLLALVFAMSLGTYLFRKEFEKLVIRRYKVGIDLVKTLFDWIPLIGLTTIFIVLPSTRSRSAWLAIALVSLFLLAFHKKKLIKRVKEIDVKWIVIGSFTVAFCLITLLFGIYQFKKESADGRLLIWKVSTHIIKENPLFGVGFDRFKTHYMDAQATYFFENKDASEVMRADNNYYAFNELTQLTVENGIIGLLFFFLLLICVLKTKVIQEFSSSKVISLAVLFCGFVFGCFSYPAQILPIKVIMIFSIALIASLDTQKRKITLAANFFHHKKIRMTSYWLSKIFVLFVAVVFTWTSIINIKKIKKGYQFWKIGLDTYNSGLYKESLSSFNSALPFLGNQGDFLMSYGKALVMVEENEQAVAVLNKAKNFLNTSIIETALGDAYMGLGRYADAEKIYKHAGHMIPNRFFPQYRLAQMYLASGQNEKARMKAIELLKKEVKIPSTAIREIKLEMKKVLENMSSTIVEEH